jgi:hypothetical protein
MFAKDNSTCLKDNKRLIGESPWQGKWIEVEKERKQMTTLPKRDAL